MTNLEQLNANGSKHELQKESDEHDVVDGTNGDDDTLYDMLLVIIQHNAHFAYVFTCTKPLSSHTTPTWYRIKFF